MTAARWTTAFAALVLATSPALARHRYHHAPLAPAEARVPYGDWGGWQAEVIARETARQQAAPGVTEELAPDAKQTATGGPSGGVPGFSGH